VELFQTGEELLVNELAPRPHNSGHYTIEGCVTSQFENHVRSILGWPIGSTSLRAPAVVMVNTLGRETGPATVANYGEVLEDESVHLHIYGKTQSRPGRKLGHITVLADSSEVARRRAEEAESRLRWGGGEA
jgi:5-(carboxyamino)imidazole ribonucleotide synthase